MQKQTRLEYPITNSYYGVILPSADLFQATLYIPCLAALLVPSAVQSKVPMLQVNE